MPFASDNTTHAKASVNFAHDQPQLGCKGGQPEVLQGAGGVRLRDMNELDPAPGDLASLDHNTQWRCLVQSPCVSSWLSWLPLEYLSGVFASECGTP